VAYPNPFSERLWIGFTLGAPSQVELVVYNVAGEVVYRRQAPGREGTQLMDWDGRNPSGAPCASGIYMLRLKADGAVGWESEWLTVAILR